MKKSRIIVPALAMLTLSVAASVTGTVAWFTASRTASMSVENLAALEQVNTEQVINFCRHCGRMLDYQIDKYCKHCGKQLF